MNEINTTNFIPFIYSGYYNHPHIHDARKQIKVWLVEEVEFFNLPDSTGVKGSFINNEGKEQFFITTDIGLLRCISTGTYVELFDKCARIPFADDDKSRLHIDPDYLISLYDQKFLDFVVIEYDRRIVQWQTKEELRIKEEKLQKERKEREDYDAAKAAVMKPFIDQAKAKNGTDSLTEDQQHLLERITHFDYTYHYSDDGAVWRHYSKVEGEINDSASAMGLFVGALSAMSRFISSYRPEK